MKTKKDAENVTITYIYDELNRLEEIQFPDPSQNITYTYDDPQSQNSIGRLSSMTDPSGTTWYDYDVMGKITMETKQINGLNYRTQYTYDLNGNLETITYPGGRITTYGYNQLNKVTSITETMNGVTNTLVNNITYLPFGDVLSLTHGNGIVTTKTYNNRYQLTGLDIGTVKDLTFTRDNTGNITGITDNLVPAKNKSYTYDNLYRLDTATGQWGTLDYAYDNVGNRTDETTDIGSTTYNYTLNTNKLETTTGEKALSFSYDNNGNTTGENSRQYNYNQHQRLTQAVEGTDIIGEYVYNGNGQRVKKYTENGTKCTIYHYDQNGLLIAESSSTGNVKAEYVYLNGQPLAKIEGNNVYYYHNDHLSTSTLMTDETGTTVWEGEYLPFGEALSVSGTVTNNLRFPGQYYDAETGLHYNYFRDYKPEIGRYVEADPIGIDMMNNHLYAFVGSNPMIFMDPFGLKIQGRWVKKPSVSDIDIMYNGWDFAIGKPKLIPPGIRVALIHLHASGVLSFIVECTDDECDEKKKWTYAPSFGVGYPIDVPVRVNIFNHPVIKVAVIAKAINKAYKIAKNKFTRLAATYAVDPTFWCYVSLLGGK
jgi:RHS repeat-associated protein